MRLARRTGRFPQLVDPRSGVNRDRFATISPNSPADSDQRLAQPCLPISACTRPRISSRMVPFVNLLIESERTSRLTDDAGQNIVF
jgi:hypothetical protein